MKCPVCKKYFSKKGFLVDHINDYHPSAIPPNMNVDQFIYYSNYGKLTSKCMCGCGKDTGWNYNTGKPSRLTDDPECKMRVREIALKNGADGSMLQDMGHQKKMQENRKIAKTYKFKDGAELVCLGTYEYAFLKFCEEICELTGNMIMEAYQTFKYKDGGVERTYMPDFYLPDYNLLVEIKSSNAHAEYEKTTGYKVKLKDAAMKKQKKYNYIRITDNKFGPFLEILYNIRIKRNVLDDKEAPVILSIAENTVVIPDGKLSLYLLDVTDTDTPDAYISFDNINGYHKHGEDGKVSVDTLPDRRYKEYECVADDELQEKFIKYYMGNDSFVSYQGDSSYLSILNMLTDFGIRAPEQFPNECDFILKGEY